MVALLTTRSALPIRCGTIVPHLMAPSPFDQLTVRIAALVVALPAGLVKTARYW